MAKIIGHGAPTSATPGILGQEYFDVDSKQVYTCVNVTDKLGTQSGEIDTETEWAVLGGSGSAAAEPFIVQVSNIGYTNDIRNPEETLEAFLNNRTLMAYVSSSSGTQYGGTYLMILTVGILNTNTSGGDATWELTVGFMHNNAYKIAHANISDPNIEF